MGSALSNRIASMPDEKISEIIFNKADWSEDAFQIALQEAAKRGLSIDRPPASVLQDQERKRAHEQQPLSKTWKTIAILAPFGMYSIIIYAFLIADRREKMASDLKKCFLISIAIWLSLTLILNMIF